MTPLEFKTRVTEIANRPITGNVVYFKDLFKSVEINEMYNIRNVDKLLIKFLVYIKLRRGTKLSLNSDPYGRFLRNFRMYIYDSCLRYFKENNTLPMPMEDIILLVNSNKDLFNNYTPALDLWTIDEVETAIEMFKDVENVTNKLVINYRLSMTSNNGIRIINDAVGLAELYRIYDKSKDTLSETFLNSTKDTIKESLLHTDKSNSKDFYQLMVDAVDAIKRLKMEEGL